MRLCVVDCSFALAWVFEDERDTIADELLGRLSNGDSFDVPAVLWGLEVRNALRGAVRRRRLTPPQAEERRLLLGRMPRVTVTTPPGLGDELDALIRAHGLTSYDAVYLALALEHGLPLATKDSDLRVATLAAGGEVFTGGRG